MARYTHDDSDDDDLDPEGPDARDLGRDEDDDSDTIDCPNCGRAVYAGAEQCPKCGAYVLDAQATSSGWPMWVKIVVLICAAMFLLSVVF